MTEFRIILDPSEGRQDIVYNLDTPEGLDKLAKNGVVLKEGCKYKFKISFRVQHEIGVFLYLYIFYSTKFITLFKLFIILNSLWNQVCKLSEKDGVF